MRDAPMRASDSFDHEWPESADPAGSHLSESDFAAWFRRAHEPVGLGRLGPYELLAEIGHGAQGTVFRARQPGTKRDVVLKRPAAGAFATPRMRARFEREIEVLASLRHPNIVTVHATEVVDGQPLLVMEWVDGVPIDRWAAGRASTRDVLTTFIAVCQAVHHAHQQGVIHCDLKPSNVLVDRVGQPHVLDFGLARLVGPGASAIGATLSEGFVGTPAYASPEQISGKRNEIDARSDVFSLGVMLYEALTERWPFAAAGERGPGVALLDVFDAIRKTDPTPPSRVCRSLGAEVDAVVLKAIARDPGERYTSADALADDLRRYLAGHTVLAHPPTALYQLRKLASRHRAAFAVGTAIASVVLLAAVVSTAFAIRLAHRHNELAAAQTRERRERERAEAEADKVRATNIFLQELLSTNDPLLKLRPDIRLRELLEEAGHALDSGVLADQPEVEAALRTVVGRTYTRMKMPSQGEPHLRRALELQVAQSGDESLTVADVARQLALCLCEQRKFGEGIALHQRALMLHRALAPHDDVARIDILWRFSTALRDNSQLDEAESAARQALDIALRLYGARHEATAESRFRLGWILSLRRKLDEAEQQQRQALALQRELLGAAHPACGESLLRLGQTLDRTGQPDEAEALLREAVSILRASMGDEHPNTSRARGNLARFLARRGQYDEAESLFAESAIQAARYYGYRNANVAKAIFEQANVRVRRGDAVGAEELMREALALFCDDLCQDHAHSQMVRLALADLLVRQGRFAEAEPLLLEAPADSSADPQPRDAGAEQPGPLLARMVKLYEAWHAAEPGKGYDARAAEWRSRLAPASPRPAAPGEEP